MTAVTATMFANLLDSPAPLSERPLDWRETARPVAGSGQLVIRVIACGVCRSNLHMIEGDWLDGGTPAFTPIAPGHEVTGEVVEVAADVTDFRPGDVIGVQPLWWTCEECEFCTSGREMLCHQRQITGETVDGGYAEYMLATATHSYLLPDGLDPVDAAPLFCPGITAFAAVDKLGLDKGDVVAVFGLGGVGHMAVQFAALTGAEVIGVGRNEEHLAVARELGADRTVNSTDADALAAIADSADAVLNFAPADTVTAQALRTLKWGGTLVSAVPITVSNHPFSLEQTIRGSVLGNREQMREVLRLAAEGKIRTVTERFAMADATEALDRLAAGTLPSRAVLTTEA